MNLCGAVEVRNLADVVGLSCSNPAIERCSDRGVEICDSHAESCGVCHAMLCPRLFAVASDIKSPRWLVRWYDFPPRWGQSNLLISRSHGHVDPSQAVSHIIKTLNDNRLGPAFPLVLRGLRGGGTRGGKPPLPCGASSHHPMCRKRSCLPRKKEEAAYLRSSRC